MCILCIELRVRTTSKRIALPHTKHQLCPSHITHKYHTRNDNPMRDSEPSPLPTRSGVRRENGHKNPSQC